MSPEDEVWGGGAVAGRCLVRTMKWFTLLTSILWATEAEGGHHERRLLNDLFLYYDKRERPVRNETETVDMTFAVE